MPSVQATYLSAMSKRSLSPAALPPSKRSLSPAALPPSKRLHSLSGSAPLIALTFESALYEELVLLIFAHLSWVDLCAAQGVSKNWARLSLDSGLWKKQYLQVFGRSRLRGAKGFIGRTDGREVKKLPERAAVPESLELKDWRWMFRISWNWKKGEYFRIPEFTPFT
jgi:hypothetical protein